MYSQIYPSIFVITYVYTRSFARKCLSVSRAARATAIRATVVLNVFSCTVTLHHVLFALFFQEKHANKNVVFGPRSGTGRGIMTSDGAVYWDDDAAGKTGVAVQALMHSAILESK